MVPGETQFCLKLRVQMVSFDIVITGDPKSALPGNPTRFFDATRSPQRDMAMLKAKEDYSRLHHLIFGEVLEETVGMEPIRGANLLLCGVVVCACRKGSWQALLLVIRLSVLFGALCKPNLSCRG